MLSFIDINLILYTFSPKVPVSTVASVIILISVLENVRNLYMVDVKEMPIIFFRMMLAILSVSKECTVVVQKIMEKRKYHLLPLPLPCHHEHTLPIV